MADNQKPISEELLSKFDQKRDDDNCIVQVRFIFRGGGVTFLTAPLLLIRTIIKEIVREEHKRWISDDCSAVIEIREVVAVYWTTIATEPSPQEVLAKTQKEFLDIAKKQMNQGEEWRNEE